MTADSAVTSTRPHFAARLERFFSRQIRRLLVARGRTPRIETYAGLGNESHIRIICRVLLYRSADVYRARRKRYKKLRGWRRFLTAEVPAQPVTLTAAGRTYDLMSDADGYIDVIVNAPLAPGWHELTLAIPGGDSAVLPVLVVGPGTTHGIVSDIDDTVMVTQVPRPLIAFWNAFVRPEVARRPVPGMSELYDRYLAHYPGSPVVYLSTGAWNVSPAIEAFIDRFGLPDGPTLLTDWGPTNTGWFRSGIKHKRDSLRMLTHMFPWVQWLLVGDDGQHDPAIYAEFAAENPSSTDAVAIRQLNPVEQVLSHGFIAPNDPLRHPAPPIPVVEGVDGFELAAELAERGILPQ